MKATKAETEDPRTKATMPARIRSVLSSSWRSIHCRTKNTKIALTTTCRDAVLETAWEDATTPARMKTKEPKYHPGAGGAFGGGRRERMRNPAASKKNRSLRSNALPTR